MKYQYTILSLLLGVLLLNLYQVESKIELTPPDTGENGKIKSQDSNSVSSSSSSSSSSPTTSTTSTSPSATSHSNNIKSSDSSSHGNPNIKPEDTPEFSPPSDSLFSNDNHELNIKSVNKKDQSESDDESAEDSNLIKIKFGPPEVIQIVPPPDLTKKLAGTETRREPEVPESKEPIDAQGKCI